MHGSWRMVLTSFPGGDTLGRVVCTAMTDGTWARLKTCRIERCQKAFYDTSPESLLGVVFDGRLR